MRTGILVTKLWLMLTCVVGCSHGDGSEPTYEGCASDENWRTFDDYISTARIKNDGASSPKWLAPMDGWTAPSSMPASFSWQPTPNNAGSVNGNASCAQFTPTSLGGLQPRHEPPVSGLVFDIHFAIAGSETYRVLTTRQIVAIPDTVWQDFIGKHVDVTLYSAQLLRNDVAEGLFRAAPMSIFVTP